MSEVLGHVMHLGTSVPIKDYPERHQLPKLVEAMLEQLPRGFRWDEDGLMQWLGTLEGVLRLVYALPVSAGQTPEKGHSRAE